MSDFWDHDAIRKLRTMIDEGKSSRAIAQEIGAPSRNSVIGKANRLGLHFHSNVEPTVWTAERDAILRKMWADNIDARDIGARIGGFTAASVRNRAWRLKFSQRSRADVKRMVPTVSAPAAPAPIPAPIVVVLLPALKPASEPRAAGPLHFLDGQSGRCRFPLWSNEQGIPIEAKFVCAAPAGSSAYCPEHKKVCFGIGSWGERAAHKIGGVSSASVA
jgi:hypothetical protein